MEVSVAGVDLGCGPDGAQTIVTPWPVRLDKAVRRRLARPTLAAARLSGVQEDPDGVGRKGCWGKGPTSGGTSEEAR